APRMASAGLRRSASTAVQDNFPAKSKGNNNLYGLPRPSPAAKLTSMWGRNRKAVEAKTSADAEPGVLREAVRKTRVEIAEKSSVVVDLRDAAMARVTLLTGTRDTRCQ